MSKDQYFVERRDNGKYAVIKGGAERASGLFDTQRAAADKAKELGGGAKPHIERVRHTSKGQPDKWRKE